MKFKGYDLTFLLAEGKRALSSGKWVDLYRKYRLLSSGSAGGGVNLLGVGSFVYIWSSPHTLFLANQLIEAFNEFGVEAEIIDTAVVSGRRADLEVVLAPAYFGFPFTRGPRIVFQLEQATNKRWFTPEYVNYMNSSLAIFEYSQFNLEHASQYGLDVQKIYYVPLGGSTKVYNQSQRSRSKAIIRDKKIMAYGDFRGSPRRANFAKYAADHTPSFVVHSEVFGDAMAKELESSDVVVHVNFYAPAILATPRLWESVSRGCRVVSEKAMNWTEDTYLLDLIDFVNEGEFDVVLERAKELTMVDPESQNMAATINDSELRFRFMLARGLFGAGVLGELGFTSKIDLPRKEPLHPIILSLPETVSRHRDALELLPNESIIFKGVKQSPGWVGCANSYKLMARALLSEGVTMAAICEDDVVLPEKYKTKIGIIWEYLEGLGQNWDVFVGLTADFSHLTQISEIQEYKGEKFIHSDRFTSTVFNIYSSRGLQKLASWKHNPHLSVEQNTIDRAISSLPNIKIISLEQDIFGHNNYYQSTLWGFNNSEYNDMLLRSSYIKSGLIREFELAKNK